MMLIDGMQWSCAGENFKCVCKLARNWRRWNLRDNGFVTRYETLTRITRGYYVYEAAV